MGSSASSGRRHHGVRLDTCCDTGRTGLQDQKSPEKEHVIGSSLTPSMYSEDKVSQTPATSKTADRKGGSDLPLADPGHLISPCMSMEAQKNRMRNQKEPSLTVQG